MQDDDDRFVTSDPQLLQMCFESLAAIAAEGPEGVADSDGKIDPADDPPAAYLLRAVAECAFDDPRQAMDFADGLLVLEGLLVHPSGLEPGQQMILPDQPEQMRFNRAAVLFAGVQKLGDSLAVRLARRPE
jgi:hypothetical protein